MIRRRHSLLVWFAFIATLLMALPASASHFRFGTVSWTVPNPMQPRTVRFVIQHAWATANIGSIVWDFGDASSVMPAGVPIGVGVDGSGAQYTVLESVVTHTYANDGPFTAFFEACCRVAGLINGGGASYRVSTVVDLRGANLGGPTTNAPSVIQLQSGAVRTYTFAVSDPDGDPVTCRFATNTEAGFSPATPSIPVGGAVPTLSDVAGGCRLSWNLAQAVVGQRYAMHLMMESTHAGGMASVAPLDFIVEIVGEAPPTCAGSATRLVGAGTRVMDSVTGTSANAGEMLRYSAVGVPATVTLTPMSPAMGASPLMVGISFVPTVAEVGRTYVILVNFTDPRNATGTCVLNYQVVAATCMGGGTVCNSGVGACARPGISLCNGAMSAGCSAIAGMPSRESCNNIDDNCDGMIDEMDAECNGQRPACLSAIMMCVECTTNRHCMGNRPVCNLVTNVCGDPDVDMDGLTASVEARLGTNPNNPDTDGDGVPDGREVRPGPGFGALDTDMDGTIDALDLDDDEDGILTRDELGRDGIMNPLNTDSNVPAGQGRSDMVPNYLDDDDDGDGIPTRIEVSQEAMTPADADMIPAYLDTDSDNDGVFDIVEAGGNPLRPDNSDNTDRPDFLDTDSDNDCALDSAASEAGMARIRPAANPNANCMDPTPVCNTMIGVCGADGDRDGDGLLNLEELRIGTDPNNPDSDGDGVNDGIERGMDRMGPRDTDMDGMIDALDPDDDGDGVPTAMEHRGENLFDTDNDGTPDYRDTDDDGDGIATRIELGLDTSPNGDFDRDETPSYRDTDSDDDGVPDSVEAGMERVPANTDMQMDGPDFLDRDSDNDCIPDSDMREMGRARIDVNIPSLNAEANCMGSTPVCDLVRSVCVPCVNRGGAALGCNTNDNGRVCLMTNPVMTSMNRCGCNMDADCAADRRCDVMNNACVLRPVVMDAGVNDASANDASANDGAVVSDAALDSGVLTGGNLMGEGLCSCRVPAGPTQGRDSRAAGLRGLLVVLVLAGVGKRRARAS